jgi:hypothetical protein
VFGSGGRRLGRGESARVEGAMIHARYGREELKKQPRLMDDWRRLMSLCDRRQRAATKVVLDCYLDKDRTGRGGGGNGWVR